MIAFLSGGILSINSPPLYSLGSFKNIVNDLEEIYGKLEETHFSRTIYCHPTFSEMLKTGEALFEKFVDLLQSSKQYLYLTPVTIDLTEESDEDSEGSPGTPDTPGTPETRGKDD